MPDSRPSTTKGNLTRLGFQEPEQSLENLALIGGAAEPLLAFLARTADPDLALASLVRLVEAAGRQSGETEAGQLLADIEEAREELDHAWAPLAAGFADVALGSAE